jgi:hypothetical protein
MVPRAAGLVDLSRLLKLTSRLGVAGVFPLRAHTKWRPTMAQTQAAAAAGDGFVTYDELRGPMSHDSFQPADSVKTPPHSPPSGDVPTAAGTYRRRQSWQRRC